ncbi:MAG: flagellar hook-basal body protein [Oscillospiraceae bacterium]|jgi:flagellar basal body rod protein FlgG|nr:flagellar hook-basal body protein [Oscillospiraceae bacterium]
MFEAVYMAASGLVGQQRRLDVIADNVANVNSLGHRANRADFADALYTAGLNPSYPRTPEPEGNQRHGHGVTIASITRESRQGSFIVTGNELDFAIDGPGFLEVQNGAGAYFYRRGGSFYISEEPAAGERGIVDSDGYFLTGEYGTPVMVPDGAEGISVSSGGALEFKLTDGSAVTGDTLPVYTFVNEMGLDSAGADRYVRTDISGEMTRALDSGVISGSVESSNVDLAKEMTNMIRAQRAFSLAARALTTADDMEGLANALRK